MSCSPGVDWMVDTGMEVNPWLLHTRFVPLGVHWAPAPVKMAKENKQSIEKAMGSTEESREK